MRTHADETARRGRRPAGATGPGTNESRYAAALGRMVVFWNATGVCALVFEEGRDACRASLTRHGANAPRRAPLPAPIRRALDAYFRGRVDALDRVPLDLVGTPFQRRVWNALRRIPPGRPLSYRALAVALGSPRGARAVGRAAALNPVSLIVPCHRLVGSDGALTGFLWGIERKRRLLEHEAAHAMENGCGNDRARRTAGTRRRATTRAGRTGSAAERPQRSAARARRSPARAASRSRSGR